MTFVTLHGAAYYEILFAIQNSGHRSIMAGAEGFEPPKTVLETAGLPLSLRPCIATSRGCRRPGFKPLDEKPETLRGFPAGAGEARLQTGSVRKPARLLHFPMVRVLAALAAELAELKTLRRGLAVLGRRVILILAYRALELANFTSH